MFTKITSIQTKQTNLTQNIIKNNKQVQNEGLFVPYAIHMISNKHTQAYKFQKYSSNLKFKKFPYKAMLEKNTLLN